MIAFDRAVFHRILRTAGLPAGRAVDGVRLDAEALYDGVDLFVGGIVETVAADCLALPAVSVGADVLAQVRRATRLVARAVGERGPLTVRFALVHGVLHGVSGGAGVSRRLPFVAQATGFPLVEAATAIALGTSLANLRAGGLLPRAGPAGPRAVAVRRAGTTAVAGSFGRALARCHVLAGRHLPTG